MTARIGWDGKPDLQDEESSELMVVERVRVSCLLIPWLPILSS